MIILKLGYIRVSSKDQSELRQLKKMKELGIEERFIFIDKKSGKDFDREQYQALRRIIREGDLLYLDSLDRLGRNYEQVIDEWKYITRILNADIVILENEAVFDSRKFKSMGDTGKLMEDQFLSLLSYVADQERKKIKQRQAEGIYIAQINGVKFGRPKKEIDDKFKEIYYQWKDKSLPDEERISAVKAMSILNLKPNTFYRRVKEFEDQIRKGDTK